MTTARRFAALVCLALAGPAAAQQGGYYAMTNMDNTPAGKMIYNGEWGKYSIFLYEQQETVVYLENQSAQGGGSMPVLNGYYVPLHAVENRPAPNGNAHPSCPSGSAVTHVGTQSPGWGRVRVETSPDRSTIFMRVGICDGQPVAELAGAWQN